MHRDEQRRCLSEDDTLVLLAKCTEFEPSFKRDNLLSLGTTCTYSFLQTTSRARWWRGEYDVSVPLYL